MKSVIFTSAIVLTMFFLPACKKSESSSLTTAQKVQNKWQLVTDTENDHYSSLDHITTSYGNPTDYMDFRTDGKMYAQIGGYKDTLAYFLTGDTKITFSNSGGTFDIKTLTSNSFVLYGKEMGSGTNFIEETITLKR